MKREVLDKASRVSMLILDVDGTLTEGALYYDANGEALKRFNVRDGAAIKWLQRAGIEVAVITGRTSLQSEARARELGIEKIIQGAVKKLPVFEAFLRETHLAPERIAYMGDDYHDLPILRRVGLALVPADAVDEARKIAHWIAPSPGGHGAVREAAELILRALGKWDEIISVYFE